MSNLAVIGTFHRRHENSLPLVKRLIVDSTRKPDEVWLMCEDDDDVYHIDEAIDYLYEVDMITSLPPGLRVIVLNTPRDADNYKVIPYSFKINYALDRSASDYYVYLDNGSMPTDDKFELMAKGLDEHPEWGAVYCDQKRTGFQDIHYEGNGEPVKGAHGVLNYTQVMHRRTPDRWTLDMQHANPDIADGLFWESLHKSLGDFHHVSPGRILDVHHIPSYAAVGIGD